MAIVWANVEAVAPELSTVALATQTALLAQVNREVDDDNWEDEDTADCARAWLAAHLATVAARRGVGGPVVSESVGQVSRSYSASIAAGAALLGSTSYGLEYERQVLSQAQFRFAISE